MGVPRGVVRLLLDEARERPFSGAVLQLGRSTVYCRGDELERWATAQGVALRPWAADDLSHVAEIAAQGCLSDRALFGRLGFDEVVALDVSNWEGVELVHDLNRPVPEAWWGRFDAVFEAGTLQHVFDLRAALANIHRLLKPGGRVIHGMAPSTNHVDHGFYMFSPTFFHDYYAANRYRIETELFFEFTPLWVRGRFASPPWRIYRYQPGDLDHLAYGGFGRQQVGLFVVATKRPESTGEAVPHQSYYTRVWPELEASAAGRASRERSGARSRIPTAALYLWKRLRAGIVRLLPRRMPPVHRRY
jgi:SAM-dependent methyltransferase